MTTPWIPELDALIAAPGHHRVLLDNEHVRVLDTRIEPGDLVPLHTHRWPAAYYFVSTGEIVRRDEHGVVTYDSRVAEKKARAGEAAWMGALTPHTLENVGKTVVHVVSVEVKGA